MALKRRHIAKAVAITAPQVEELESRLLLSADPVGAFAPDSFSADPIAIEYLLDENFNSVASVPAVQDTDDERLELVFVDTDTPDYQQLVDDLLTERNDGRRIEVYLLDNLQDGVSQISSILDAYQSVDALHLISHGSDGSLDLGATQLANSNLFDFQQELQGWGEHLDPAADILIYGCNLAASAEGFGLIDALASLTGADIAASDDLTGSAALGGDWVLERSTGEIESDIVISAGARQSYNNILPASFIVDTLNDTADVDPGNGLAEDTAGNTSLRAAIEESNVLGGADSISIGAGTFILDGAELTISSDITITGAGIDQTFIDAANLSRIFNITSGTVTLNNLTIQNADALGNNGGAINVGSTAIVTLNDILLFNNTGKEGGAIYNDGTLQLQSVTIDGNTSVNKGGGLHNLGSVTAFDTTISNNTSGKEGGGVYENGATTAFTNVTISGNSTTNDNGGGFYSRANAFLQNVTVTNNTAGGPGTGGGIFEAGSAASLRNVIVAGNTAAADADVAGTFTSLGNNLIGDIGAASGLVSGVNGDQVGNAASPIDPLLGALADNGGPTLTHALVFGSSAIDAGTSTGAPTTDQSGKNRDANVDIGAFEYVTGPFVVNTTADTADVNPGNGLAEDVTGNTSIRAAIEEANVLGGADSIIIGAGTFILDGTQLTISSDITITGAGADQTFIDANNLSRVFHITSGSVTITGVTITGGNASGQGGGISNQGVLTMDQVRVTENTAGRAGGLYNHGGTATITRSLFDANTATADHAGAIWNAGNGASLTMTNTTISGNTAAGSAGGFWNGENASLTNVTITANTATASNGGGINITVGGFVTNLTNTIVAGNSAANGADINGAINSQGFNIIGDTTDNSGWTADDQQNVDPSLGALLDNGGPTLSHELVFGSAAINAGTNIGAPTTDQRGDTRDASTDIGAYEYTGNPGFIVVDTTADYLDTDLNYGDTSSIAALLADKGDDNLISLREAIDATENTANGATPDRIDFAILADDARHFYYADDGVAGHVTLGNISITNENDDALIANIDPDFVKSWYSINTGSSLPNIYDAVVLDGTTQAGFVDSPIIELDGSGSGSSDGLIITSFGAGGSTLRGLVINGFNDGIELQLGGNNLIVGNYFGTDVSGTIAVGNADNGIDIYESSNNIIGGTTEADRNLISGNAYGGVYINGFGSSTGNTVQGNYIGTDVTGLLALGNGAGVQIMSESSNVVGGAIAGAGNLIAFNTSNGVSVEWASATDNAILGNSIHSNALLGIDIATDGYTTYGVTLNDVDDVDTGANGQQNFPVLSTADSTGTQITITGSFNSTANSDFRIEFFSNSTGDVSGYGEGQTYLGFVNVATDNSGNAIINAVLTASVASGEFISATATVSDVTYTTFTATSEFAQSVVVNSVPAAANDTYAAPENTLVTTGNVLANDNLGDAPTTITAFDATGTNGGTITYNNDGTFNYMAATDFIGTDTFNYTITDADSETSTATVTMTVSGAANVSPVLDDSKSPALSPVEEDAGAPVLAVGSLVSELVDFATPSGQVDNVTDPDSGASLGIAVTAADTTNGTWFYSINDGNTWNALGAVSEANARLLAADTTTRLYFQANAGYHGTLANAITFRAWDQTSGTNGGTAVIAGTSTVLDTFSANTYTNNEGTAAWNNGWIEVGVGPGPDSGAIKIKDSVLRLVPDTAGEYITREANLFGAGVATLTYSYDSTALTSGSIEIQVSNNGGTSYTTLKIYSSGNAGTGTETFDIAAYASADTTIRFYVSSTASGGPGKLMHVDDVKIEYSTTGGGSSAFSTSYDTASLAVNPVNDAPVITFPGGTYPYTENAGAVLVGEFATVSDVDSADFAGGQFVYQISNNGLAEDRLDIRNQGTSAGQIGVSGLNITYGGAVIGTYSGATTGATLLVVDFNSTATVAAVEATLKNATYENTSEDPTASTRSLQAYITDGDGGTSNTVSGYVAVTPVNDAPTISSPSGTYPYTENAGAVVLGGSATISDVDSADFNGGQLVYQISNNGLAEDRLDIRNQGTSAGQIGVSGLNITYGGTLIGTYSGATSGATSLIVDFNSAATVAAVEATLKNVTYENTSEDPTASTRTVQAYVTDGDGGTSNTIAGDVAVTPVNDAPTITSTAPTTATEDTLYTYTATVSDPDDANNGTDLTWSLSGAPAGMVVSSTGVVTWTPPGGVTSSGSVTLRVSDGNENGAVDATEVFTITVTPVNEGPTITSTAGTTATEDTLYTYAATVSDPDDANNGTDLTWSLSGEPAGMVVSSTGVVTWTPTEGITTSGSVTLTVSDGNEDGAVDATEVFTITVTPVNDAPTITSTAPTTATEDTLYTYTATVNDPDDANNGTDLTWSLSGAPAGMVVSSTGVVTWTPTGGVSSSGSVTLTVSDGNEDGAVDATESFTITVTPVNDAPTITSTAPSTATEDTLYTYTATVIDPDDSNNGTDLTWSLSGAPAGMVVSSTGVVTWTPTEGVTTSGSVTLTVSDGNENGAVDATEVFTISVTSVNDAPTITSTAPTAATEDTLYTYTATVSDPDDANNGTDLTWSLSGEPAGMVVSSTGVVTWTPTEGVTSSNSVTLTVSDGNEDGAVAATETFTVTVTPVNDGPTITSTAGTTATEGTLYTYTATVTDPDDANNGTDLTWSLSGAPAGMVVSSTGVVTWTPADGVTSSGAVTLTVSDGNEDGALDATEVFTITVTQVNQAPTITSTAGTTATEDTVYTYTATVSDPDDANNGTDLTWSLSGAPAGMAVSSTGVVTWTPTEGVTTSGSVTLTVSDGNEDGAVDATEVFTISVTAVNDAPLITSTAGTTANEDTLYTYTATVTDPDDANNGTDLTWSLSGAPAGMVVSSTGVVTWTPLEGVTTSGSVTLTVSDGNEDGAVADTEVFTITVTPVNEGPTITSTAGTTATEDTLYTYTATVTDPDDANNGTDLTWSLSGEPAGMVVSSTGVVTWTPTEGVISSGSVTLTVSDGNENGAVDATEVFTIAVTPVNDAPTIASTAGTTANEGMLYTYTAMVNDPDDANNGIDLTWSLSGEPAGMVVSSTGVVTWTPAVGVTTSGSVTLTVSDGHEDGAVDATEVFTITVTPVNEGPTITSTAGSYATEDILYTYTATVSDPDDANNGTDLTWSLSGEPAGMVVSSTGVVTWTPTEGITTSGTVTLTVSDGNENGAVDGTETFTIIVTPVNDAPTITSTAPTAATEDTLYTYTATVSDPDDANNGTDLTWSLSGAPAGMVVSSTGVVTWTPTGSTTSSGAVTLTVSDGKEDGAVAATEVFTITVAVTNDAPTGNVRINSTTPAQGDRLTASNDLADADGMGSVTYQWQRDGVNIATAKGNTYTTVQADVGAAITVVASYRDGSGFDESVASSPTAAVTNVNDAPTGSVLIDSVTPTEGDLLTASNTLADVDGLGAITYQWHRDGAALVGETANQYALTQGDVGATISVIASYVDKFDTRESVSSAVIGPVLNRNDLPTGAPVINGIPEVGETLTAQTSTIADLDGLGVFNYDWQRASEDGVSWESVGSGETYVPVEADSGAEMRVMVSYTDGYATLESLFSYTMIFPSITPVDPSFMLSESPGDDSSANEEFVGGNTPTDNSGGPAVSGPATKEEAGPVQSAETTASGEREDKRVGGSTRAPVPSQLIPEAILEMIEAATQTGENLAEAAISEQAIVVEPQTLAITPTELERVVMSGTSYTELRHVEAVLNNPSMWQGIETMKREMDNSDSEKEALVVEIVSTTGAGLMAGLVAYGLRGGALVASLMSTVPLWQGYDPLPILSNKKADPKRSEKTDASDSEEEKSRDIDILFE